MEECRAWTKAPIERTFAVQVVAQTRLKLLARRLDATCGPGGWWSAPEWSRRKRHASLLDVRRVMWASREAFSDFLREQDESPEIELASEDCHATAA